MDDLLLTADAVAKQPGDEPIPGYRLIARLGRGGFGEVWKCEAPGGLLKAIKFVATTDGDALRQEMGAFEQIKAIRHPFLLTLERVEVVGEDLAMVMELADCQLLDRYRECYTAGGGGIPREELLGYMREAAEALDTMGAKYGLQHLDVKPENIFLVAGHAKVGDYGLVRRANRDGEQARGGFTPKYTAPEVLMGGVDIRSDQYSLALMYVELLTGSYPYPGKSAQQLMLQHVRGVPILAALPESDRPAVERALAKDPADRFPTCSDFVRKLTAFDRLSLFQSVVVTAGPPLPAAGSPDPQAEAPTQPTRATRPQRLGVHRVPAPQPAAADPFADLFPVMRVDDLHRPRPRADRLPDLTPREFAEAVIRAACGRHPTPEIQAAAAAAQVVRFLSTIPPAMMPYKLVVVAERWGLSARQTDAARVVLRREVRQPAPKPAKAVVVVGGLEVVVHLPTPPAVEVTATATLFGRPDDAFVRTALTDIPTILSQIRSQLQNLEERRIHPRHPAELPVRVYPLFPDGEIGRGIDGVTRDVSVGGVRFVTPAEVHTDRVFVQFPQVGEVAGSAVYVRVLRANRDPAGPGVVSVGRYRVQQADSQC